MRVIEALLLLCVALGGCGSEPEGDDPQLGRLVESVVPAGNIMATKKNGSVRIFSLQLVDQQALQLLPRLGELKNLTTLAIGYPELKDEDLRALSPVAEAPQTYSCEARYFRRRPQILGANERAAQA